MKNLAIIVHDLTPASEFSVEKMLMWLKPLKVENLGAIPIFQANTIEEFALVVNLYDLENIVISNSKLIELFYRRSIEQVEYQIHTISYLGKQFNILILPDNEDVVWDLAEESFDRFEELS